MDTSSSSNIAGLAPASLIRLALNRIDQVELPVAMWKSRWQMKGYARELLRRGLEWQVISYALCWQESNFKNTDLEESESATVLEPAAIGNVT